MSCDLIETGERTRVVLSYRRERLLYDIGNYAYVEGKGMETEDARARSFVQDITDEGNVDLITREMDLAVERCRDLLHSYTNTEISRRYLDDKLRETPVYGIVMDVPTGFSQTSLNLLEKLIQRYVVFQCVREWMSLTFPAKTEAWELKINGVERGIRACMNSRARKVRRRLHPF